MPALFIWAYSYKIQEVPSDPPTWPLKELSTSSELHSERESDGDECNSGQSTILLDKAAWYDNYNNYYSSYYYSGMITPPPPTHTPRYTNLYTSDVLYKFVHLSPRYTDLYI